MRKVSQLIVYSLVLMIAFSEPSYGWNNRGHMMVAAIAYDHLTPAIKNRVDQLLRLNPQRSDWFDLIPASASPTAVKKMLFMIAATFPDRIKSDPDFTTDGSHGGNRPPNSPIATQNIGYEDLFRHKYWHFVDEPFGGTLPTPTPNAKDRIELFIETISKPTSADVTDDIKSYDLCWLLHLMGDVHQPLHCITRITSDDTDGDDGGNDVRLNPSGKLHSFWDGILGGGDVPSTAITAARNLATAPTGLANDLDVQHWIDESFEAAKRDAYKNPPIGNSTGPFTPTAAYRARAITVAKARVALAGARLAKILNERLR